jgi:hypothetical protein
MFQQLQNYIIIGLLVALVVVGGAAGLYYRITKAEIDTLHASAAKYEVAIELQDKTINRLQADAKLLAESTKTLNDTIQKTENNFVVEWQNIESMDFSPMIDAAELERKINDEFKKSIDGLRTDTDGSKSGGVRK